MPHATVGPKFKVVERVDDAAAEFSICGAGAVGAMLFEGSGRQAKKLGRFLGAQVAWRKNDGFVWHGSGLQGGEDGRCVSAADGDHGGGGKASGGMGKIRRLKSPPLKLGQAG
jgi:hypothetical protein